MAEAGLGDGDGVVEPWVELIAPVAKESAFADAVGATEEHEAVEGGALREVGLGLLDLRVVLLIVLGVIAGEGDAGGSPLMGVAVERGFGEDGHWPTAGFCRGHWFEWRVVVNVARSFGVRVGC